MKTKGLNLFDFLHIAGSIASITGIAILIIERSIEHIDIGYIIAYLLSGCLVIGVIALFLGLGKELFSIFLINLKGTLKFGLAILLSILLIVFAIILILLIFELFTPFIVLLINRQYP